MSENRFEIRYIRMGDADEWLKEQAQNRKDDEWLWEPFAVETGYVWFRRITKVVKE